MERATVRVAVRSEDKGAAWKKRGAEVAVVEDIADADALTRAFEGVTGAYVLNPPDYQSNDMFARAEQVASAIIEAAQRAHLPKLVALSSIGSHLPRKTGNILTTYILEEALKSLQAEIAVGFVRAASIMENWQALLPIAQQKGILPSFHTPLERAIPMVAAADIGQACADGLMQEWQGTQIWELHGPEAVSPNQVAASFSRALKCDVQAVVIPESEWSSTLAQMGNSPAAVESYSEMMRAFNNGTMVFEEHGTKTVRGKTTIDEVVHSWIDSSSHS
ncbi:NmrA family NAD(P)-binding protein [Nostoc sp.]|uniref:NmrA family NAD(P)-binding protein n=1 Tax=Nostoc sp. TaxID=1180 RepID=UPI002FF500B3